MVLYIAHDALLFKPKFKSKLINNLYTWIKSRSWIEVCHTFLLTYLFFLGCLSNLPFPLFSCMNDFPCVETFFFSFLVLPKWGQNIYKVAVWVFPNSCWGQRNSHQILTAKRWNTSIADAEGRFSLFNFTGQNFTDFEFLNSSGISIRRMLNFSRKSRWL